MSCDLSGDPVSIDLDRPREWNEAIRLHFYNQENELLLHGEHLNAQIRVRMQGFPLHASQVSHLLSTVSFTLATSPWTE